MAFLIDESFLPATLTAPPMTDEEFASFCAEHRDLRFEVTAEGDLLVDGPAFSLAGARNSVILGELGNWAGKKMQEWIANGAELAWLIDADARAVEIYRPGAEVRVVSGAESVSGEGPVECFVLELAAV